MLILRLLRVNQWVKNLFIFLPVFFAGGVFQFELYPSLITGFFAFCLASSSIYILNDLQDIMEDRLHPIKKDRPIASGQIQRTVAIIIAVILMALSIVMAYLTLMGFGHLILMYLIINAGYSFGLKNVSILDIFLVSSGFILRVYSGGILSDTPVSHWLAIMILLLSLFLALAKRRDDFTLNSKGLKTRKAMHMYNLEFINACLAIFSGVIIVSYIMYTISPEVINHFNTPWLFSTAVFVIAGIVRYLQITFVEENSGSPSSILFKDKFILITIVAWVISFYLIIYAK